LAESESLTARIAALETVVRQLVTRFAVCSDDPPGWVRTRKALALSVLDGDGTLREETAFRGDPVRDAIADLFDHVEQLAADYALSDRRGTQRTMSR
jgi:hypothetical protein